jgi:branched-chain amino acid transport system substrate-binding protein
MAHKRISALLLLLALFGAGPARSENGITADAIIIGQSVPLSGINALLGAETRDGGLAYFEHINKQGGIHGRKIILKTLDDGYVPERTAGNVKNLIEVEHVFALFQLRGTSHINESAKVFVPAKVPLFSCTTGALSLREPFNRYIFHTRASYQDETDKIVEHFSSVGAKSVAIFYQNDGFGREGRMAAEKALKRVNLNVAAQGSVEPNSVDVAGAVGAVAKTRPDAVIIYALFKPAAEFIRQMKKAGSAAQFLAVAPVGTTYLASELGAEGRVVVVAQVVPSPWSPTVPVVKEYLGVMKENARTDVGFTTLEAYIAAKVFVEGLRRAGRDLTREKLIKALESMTNYDVGGFPIGFSPTNHRGSGYVDITVVGEGGRVFR